MVVNLATWDGSTFSQAQMLSFVSELSRYTSNQAQFPVAGTLGSIAELGQRWNCYGNTLT
jgi:hypothetical protein